jgi:hypothetical protein
MSRSHLQKDITPTPFMYPKTIIIFGAMAAVILSLNYNTNVNDSRNTSHNDGYKDHKHHGHHS